MSSQHDPQETDGDYDGRGDDEAELRSALLLQIRVRDVAADGLDVIDVIRVGFVPVRGSLLSAPQSLTAVMASD